MSEPGTPVDDQTLMAYCDGEASAEDAARVEAALAQGGEVAKRFAMFASTRRAAANAFSDVTVPDDLAARVRSMVSADAERMADTPQVEAPMVQTARRWGWPLLVPSAVALAASIAAMVLALGMVSSSAPPLVPADALLARSGTSVPVDGGVVRLLMSFRDAGGSLCREYVVEAEAAFTAVACERDGAFALEVAVASPPAQSQNGVYVPASGLDALDAHLAAIGAGPTLSADEEAAALNTLKPAP